MSNFTITISAPELASAIMALAQALRQKQEVTVQSPTQVAQTGQQPVAQPEITLETVRAKLAALSQSGKQSEVKNLITKFGVKKLTDIPVDKYPELMEKAGEIA